MLSNTLQTFDLWYALSWRKNNFGPLGIFQSPRGGCWRRVRCRSVQTSFSRWRLHLWLILLECCDKCDKTCFITLTRIVGGKLIYSLSPADQCGQRDFASVARRGGGSAGSVVAASTYGSASHRHAGVPEANHQNVDARPHVVGPSPTLQSIPDTYYRGSRLLVFFFFNWPNGSQ